MTTTPASDPEITPRRGDPTVAETIRCNLFETGLEDTDRTRKRIEKGEKPNFQRIYNNVYEKNAFSLAGSCGEFQKKPKSTLRVSRYN